MWEDFLYDVWPWLKKVFFVAWCALLTLAMGTIFLDGELLRKNLRVFSQIGFWMVLQNMGIIALVMVVATLLWRLHPVFRISWFSLFTLRRESENMEESQGANFHVMPLRVKYFGTFFGVLLLLNIPSLALVEEEMFRKGLTGWPNALWMSLVFGLVHVLVGVPLAAGLAITVAGIWFSHQYFVGGVALSTLHHSTYNTILISVLILVGIMKMIADHYGWDELDDEPVEGPEARTVLPSSEELELDWNAQRHN